MVKPLENQRQLENTQAKLKLLEDAFAEASVRPCDNEYVRELTLLSLKKRINQFKEEIAHFKAASREA